MGLISDVVLLPITGPVRGLRFVLEAIQDELEAEMLNEQKIQGALLELDLRHEARQVSDAEYEQQQSELMERLNQVRAYKEEMLAVAQAAEAEEGADPP